ncbi:MAG: HEPN domain-containing protein [Alcaligenaceae bacterium]|nr:HEPN domain-containing protein [Alcaligenaceae bacterium]
MLETYARLKQRQRDIRDSFPEGLNLRVHRALSWLDRAAREDDLDSQFVFLWIAFNAAYAAEIDQRFALAEQETFNHFIKKINNLDEQQLLWNIVWDSYSNAIRNLLNNEYVFMPFWEYQRGNKSQEQWESDFANAKRSANSALAYKNTSLVLSIVMSRIYVLRSQIVHGGATWNSSVNRHQVRDCVAIMKSVVPAIIEIMMNSADAAWDQANFPPVRD